jgi:hypothetical protein
MKRPFLHLQPFSLAWGRPESAICGKLTLFMGQIITGVQWKKYFFIYLQLIINVLSGVSSGGRFFALSLLI